MTDGKANLGDVVVHSPLCLQLLPIQLGATHLLLVRSNFSMASSNVCGKVCYNE